MAMPELGTDSEDYENLDVIRLNQHEIWIPDIVPHNDVGSWNTDKYKNLIPLYAYHDGEICWVFPTIMETICTMDVINFPYDEQRCQVGGTDNNRAEIKFECSFCFSMLGGMREYYVNYNEKQFRKHQLNY